MNTNTVNKMYGVVNGYFRCNNDRVDDLNNRISERNIPSKSLQPLAAGYRSSSRRWYAC